MDTTRLDFDSKLREILGSDNVYFSPPESIKLLYPCIIYELEPYDTDRADNRHYFLHTKYTVTYIDRDPDSGEFKEKEKYEHEEGANMVQKILYSFPFSSVNRRFVQDNLNHNVLTIYF